MSLQLERGYCEIDNSKIKVSPGSVYGNRVTKFNTDSEDDTMLVFANNASLYVATHSNKSEDKMEDNDNKEMTKHDKIPIPIPFEKSPMVNLIKTSWNDNLEKDEICEVDSDKNRRLLAAINRSGYTSVYKYSEGSESSPIDRKDEDLPSQKRKLKHQGFSVCTTFSNIPKFKCSIDPDHASIKFVPNSNAIATAHRFSRQIKFLDLEKQMEFKAIDTQSHINTIHPLCSNTIAVAEHNRMVVYDIREKPSEVVGNNTSKHCFNRITNEAMWQHEEIHSIANCKSNGYSIAFSGSERSVQLIDQRNWTISYKWQSALKYDVNYIDIVGDLCVAVGFTHPEIRAAYFSKNTSGQSIHAPSRFIGSTGIYATGNDKKPARLDVITVDGEIYSLNKIESSI